MKKFQFRLQRLLQLKEHAKAEKQKQLAKAERSRRMEEAHKQMLEERMQQEISELIRTQSNVLSVERRRRSVYYQHRLLTNLKTQTAAVANAREREERRRSELIEATRQEKVYHKLRERQEARYREECDRQEQKDTDEIASNTARRGNKSPRNKNPR